MRMKPVAVRWPNPREPKWTPIQTCRLCVLEQVDVVIAAADGAELLTGELQESALFADRRCGDPLENRMIANRVVVGAADSEADPALDLSRQPPPVVDVRRAEIGPGREVAAGDVVSDT